jgi:phosphomevalonate kinase
LVGALLNFFGVISLPANYDGEDGGGGDVIDGSGGNVERREGLRIAHNLSQICHCYAQGKVGSGFDISSAVYGTHIYTRFSEALVDEFLARMESPSSDGKGGVMQLSGGLSRRLVALVNSGEWDCTFTPFSLPPGLELLMADVCGGSESPSMARRILEWKKRRKVGFMDDYYWKDLKRCNKRIVTLLTDQFASQTIHDGLHRDGAEIISTRTAEQWKKPMPSSWHLFEGSSWDVALKLFDLRMAFLECRQNLKGMGNSAGVPVEPDEQTAVANATMALPGVVAAGVPGAGGYDALFVIYVKGPATCGGKSDRVRDEIGKLWRDMSDGSHDRVLCPLSVRAAGSGGGLCATKLGW